MRTIIILTVAGFCWLAVIVGAGVLFHVAFTLAKALA